MNTLKINAMQAANILKIRRGAMNLWEDCALYEILYDHFCPEMPYDVAAAKSGDPYEWIENRLVSMTNKEYLNFVFCVLTA